MSSNKPIYITQTRRCIYDNSSTISVIYEIETKVLENPDYTGDSRDTEHLLNLFVSNIVDNDDPSQDTFDHYATLADLDLLQISRDSAILAGDTQYRDSVNIIRFDSLSVATTAAKVVRDTINNVVDTYLEVKNSFMGTDTHYFPYNIEVKALKDQYSSDYTAARDARIAAEDAQKAKQRECDTEHTILSVRKDCLSKLETLRDYLTAMNGLVNAVGTRYKATLTSLVAGYEAQETGSATLANFKTYLASDTTNNDLVFDSTYMTTILDSTSDSTGMTLLAQIIRAYSVANSSYSIVEQGVTTSTLAVDTCSSDLKEKQEAKKEAARLEAAALSVLSTYCPDLDPDSL